MAKEVFLLDYEHDPCHSYRQNTLAWYAEHLVHLSVGQKPGVEPILFKPEAQPYVDDGKFLATRLNITSTYTAELPGVWTLPFKNHIQANACIVGTIAASLKEQSASLAPEEDSQIVVIGAGKVARDFKRLNPNGVSADRSNTDPKSPVLSSYYINYVCLG